MIYLHKILPFFVLPLGLTLILVLAGIIFRRSRYAVLGLVVLLVFSMPVTSDFLIRCVEGWEVRRPAAEMAEADAIVVLSGMLTQAPGDSSINEWNESSDRFFGGVELFRAKKARLLIFTGGWVPWMPDREPEGQILSELAVNMGIRPDEIAVTDRVFNTAAEAGAVAEMIDKPDEKDVRPRILLVTSAFHMRRSAMLFEKAGLEVIPYPVDFRVSEGREPSVIDFIPRGICLDQSETALREIYGYLYYLMKR
jgi:uncharacterized SAM-binding protein YcdF (DUF218 family)